MTSLGRSTTLTLWSIRSWLIVFSSFAINMLTMMTYTTYPVIYRPLMYKYNSDRTTLGLTFSIVCMTADVGGILCTPFIKNCGCRQVAFVGLLLKTAAYVVSLWSHSVIVFHITFGIIGGIGLGTSRLAAMCIIQESFIEHRDFMTRLTTIGYFIGDAIGPLVANYALRASGLGSTLIVLAELQAQGMALAMFYPEKRVDSTSSNLTETMLKFWRELTDLTVLKDLQFLAICVIRFTWSSCRYTLLVHVVNVAHLRGERAERANTLPALMSVTGIAIGVLNTVLVKWLNPRIGFILGVACATSGCLLAVYGNYYMLATAMVLLGCDEGMSFSTLCILLVDAVGEDQFAKALSFTDVAQIPAHFVSGPLAGWLADHTGSYHSSYIIACILGVTAIVLTVAAHFLGKRPNHKMAPDSNSTKLDTDIGEDNTATYCDSNMEHIPLIKRDNSVTGEP